MILGIIFAGVLSPYDYAEQDLTQRFALPSKEHWMGCDDYGRDLLTRLLVGGRYSLLIAILSVAIGIICGMVIGALCGFFGKRIDSTLMRIMDVIMSNPRHDAGHLYFRRHGLRCIQYGRWRWRWAPFPSSPAAPILHHAVNSQEYIEAARSFGESNFKIIMTHVIPNCMAPIIVQASLYIGGRHYGYCRP